MNQAGEPYIENGKLEVAKEFQKKGLGTSIFAKQVHHAAKAGFGYIKALAMRGPDQNGYYTWAMLGYNQDVDSLDDELADRVREDFPQAESVQDVFESEGGRERWKKHGGTFTGRFDLAPGSRSREALDDYLEEKRDA